MTSKFLVYALVDPRTDAVRYIGKSSWGMQRPKTHLKPSVINRSKNYKNSWLKSLGALGLVARIRILEEFDSGVDLSDAECFWIAQGWGLGWPLTNLTKGGDGAPGCVFSAERRRRVSETSKRVLAPDPVLVERARQLYVEEKMPGREVASLLGIDGSTVLDWGRKGGWSRSTGEARSLCSAPSPDLVERARVLYVDEKKTSKEVGRLLGKNWKTVLEWAHAGGWARSVVQATAPDPELVERARALYVNEKKGCPEVARILNVPKHRVGHWARVGGWVRPRTEAQQLRRAKEAA